MANYKVNEVSKTICVSGELTAIEKNILATYIASGYRVREKKETKKRVGYTDIKVYLKNKEKEDILAAFDKKAKEKIVDKNGKEREGGYLVALKWFKENHAEEYNEIKEAKNPKKEEKKEENKDENKEEKKEEKK